MTAKENILDVPPVAVVRKRLSAAVAETRFLRRLLKLSKEKEDAQRLRAEADAAKGGTG
jgi:hypothetical protein